MGKFRPISRFTVLPNWERLLIRLQTMSDSLGANDGLLESLGLLLDKRLTLAKLLARVCLRVPEQTGSWAVLVLGLGSNPRVIATNLAAKSADRVLGLKAILPELNRRPSSKKINLSGWSSKVKSGFINVQSVGSYENQPVAMLSLSQSTFDQPTQQYLQLVANILSLHFEKYQLQEKALASGEEFRSLTEYLTGGLVVINKDMKLMLWNRTLERLTGQKAKNVIGKELEQVFTNEEFEPLLTEIVKLFQTGNGQSFSVDLELDLAAGKSGWYNFSGSLLGSTRGEAAKAAIIIRDISNIKRLEQKKNEFISIATHEFRTPLTAIKGYLSLLARDKENLTKKQSLYLDRATMASDRLVSLAEDLLQIAQIEQGRITVKRKVVDLSALLKKIVRDFKVKAAQRGLTLTFTKPEFEAKAFLDPVRAEQIFANLVDNALKYTAKGSVKLTIEKKGGSETQPQVLVIQVRDTGIGIARDKLEGVFDKFHRVHQTEQVREQGAGLGLFIVKSFVKLQGGRITVKSRPGHGSTFIVEFPLVKKQIVARK